MLAFKRQVDFVCKLEDIKTANVKLLFSLDFSLSSSLQVGCEKEKRINIKIIKIIQRKRVRELKYGIVTGHRTFLTVLLVTV